MCLLDLNIGLRGCCSEPGRPWAAFSCTTPSAWLLHARAMAFFRKNSADHRVAAAARDVCSRGWNRAIVYWPPDVQVPHGATGNSPPGESTEEFTTCILLMGGPVARHGTNSFPMRNPCRRLRPLLSVPNRPAGEPTDASLRSSLDVREHNANGERSHEWPPKTYPSKANSAGGGVVKRVGSRVAGSRSASTWSGARSPTPPWS